MTTPTQNAPAAPEATPPSQPTMVNSADGSVITGTDPRTTPQPTFTVVNPNPGQNTSTTNPAAIFSAEDIAKARQQEKDKLYPELQTMKEQLAELKKARDEKLEEERKAREKAEADLKAERENEMSAKELLEAQKAEWEAKFAQIQQEREQERQVMEMERAYQELQGYKTQALAAAQDDIIPQLAEELRAANHTSREEVDAHIARLTATSQSIIENMQAAVQQQRAGMRGAAVTSPAPVTTDNYSANDPALEAAANGSLKFEDYVKNRDKLLSAASQMRNSGLYG